MEALPALLAIARDKSLADLVAAGIEAPSVARAGAVSDGVAADRVLRAADPIFRDRADHKARAAQLAALQIGSLWLRGDAGVLAVRPCVTVIGSRAASLAGRERAAQLGQALARRGALVLSGGALGIDAAAHEGALRAGGRTCAVLGTGVDVAYPQRHAALFRAIAARGALLSMFPPGSGPLRWHFPVRNRLMAALSDLIVVVEAQPGSGTQHTVRAARELGCPIAAFPGSPAADETLRGGARAVRSVSDVLALLDGDVGEAVPGACMHASFSVSADVRVQPLSVGQTADETAETGEPDETLGAAARRLLAVLGREPLDVSALCARTHLAAGDCAAALIDLELRGLCARLPGGRYCTATRK